MSDDVRKQVVVNGAIKVIVPVAQSYPNPDVKSEALKALINLALTEENEDAFVDSKAVPMLVATLKTGTTAQKELACLTLENLCLSSNYMRITVWQEFYTDLLLWNRKGQRRRSRAWWSWRGNGLSERKRIWWIERTRRNVIGKTCIEQYAS